MSPRFPAVRVGLRFSSPQSRVTIPRRPNDAWGHMRALMIEIKARFAQASGTVIDADNSFRIKLNNQLVIVELPGRTYRAYRGPAWRVASLLLQSQRLQPVRLGLR